MKVGDVEAVRSIYVFLSAMLAEVGKLIRKLDPQLFTRPEF
jgi:hypothetical protein